MRQIMVVNGCERRTKHWQSLAERAYSTALVVNQGSMKGAVSDLSVNSLVDLLLIDVNCLSGNNGRLTRALPLNKRARIIVTADNGTAVDMLKIFAAGADGILLASQEDAEVLRDLIAFDRDGRPAIAPELLRKLITSARHPLTLQEVALQEGTPQKGTPQKGTPTLALRTTAQGGGQAILGDPIKRASEGKMPMDDLADVRLTNRETEILHLAAKGFSRPEIADLLKISKHTVATHLSKVYDKCDISSRSEATLVARSMGLV